ncbi:Synaptic vesicle transporter SVOP and related transporters (major facilitator superfamily) [Ceraceosorus bombacis]|uniref:Synaptic vesicle transporter SVOP and related transporters (Major facilitator superfamily) n=1 Tax=Ceraceosorus bombacis TaxID=401625 RepID=A0A0P1BT39_9BASI|nr:Synaptic vesicle transporter SVOP and related transporters (major facilitator superfamily) [Ceraceosorus bombacis]
MSSLVSIAASAYSQAVQGISEDLETPHLLAVSGISFFTIAIAIFPLALAPLGESFGRQKVYLVSYGIFFLFFLPNALAQNIQTVLVARFICGAAGSVGSTMVGGTLADLWERDERDVPLAFFALSALLGTPIGTIAFTWAGGDVSWRWIFWTLLALAAPSAAAILLFFRKETLPAEARRHLAEAARKVDSASRSSSTTQVPLQSRSACKTLREAVIRSALRPLYFLLTEPITLTLSVWIAFAWGVLYLFLESLPLVFAPYGFTPDNMTRGLSFTGIAVGALLGFVLHVAILKARGVASTPEQRLPSACFGALLFSFGFFVLAWTARPGQIPWIVPQIGAAMTMTGLFLVYTCIFSYFSDCYGAYSSSAIAAQSFLRNILATAFPLIAERMYEQLTYPWASSLLGFVALALALVPFLLMWKGQALRKRSPFAQSEIGKP